MVFHPELARSRHSDGVWVTRRSDKISHQQNVAASRSRARTRGRFASTRARFVYGATGGVLRTRFAVGLSLVHWCWYWFRSKRGTAGCYAGFLGAFAFAALRLARYSLILVLGTSLCFAHTIPNTGAAGFLQPGTGHSCLGALRLTTAATGAMESIGYFRGRPGPRLTWLDMAPMTAARIFSELTGVDAPADAVPAVPVDAGIDTMLAADTRVVQPDQAVPDSAPACTNACTLGARQCGPGGGVQTCVMGSLCTSWGTEAPCTTPNGTSVCSSGACNVVSCASSYNLCSGRCVLDDPMSCGSSCIQCPTVTNANSTCRSGACGFECKPQHERCSAASACQLVNWGFESSGAEGWSITDSRPPTSGQVASSMGHTGQRSFHYQAKLDSTFYSSIVSLGRSDLCGGIAGGGVNVQGRTLSAWFYISGPELDSNNSSCTVIGFAGVERQGNSIVPPPRGQWFQIRDQLTNASMTKLDTINVSCNIIGSDPSAVWEVYMDDITIE